MTMPEMHTLTGAYAVDALSEMERAQFQRHLGECASCAQEVLELQMTATRLGAALAEDPPPELKRRVLAEAMATRQQPPKTRFETGERVKDRRRAPRWAIGAAAAAIVGLAGTAVFGGIAYDNHTQLTAANERAAQYADRYAPVADVLSAADLRTGHAETSAGGGGTVMMSRAKDRLVFMAAQLPKNDPGRTYQAWLMFPGTAPKPAGLIRGGQDGALLVAQGLSGANGFALSVEQDGGSVTGSPSDDIVMNMSMPT
ncbi:anti-sigma factor domain-containing protein [Amycolatopsis umgeniensis]|uniref:Regulator of SigK n=1 Tax=Amycolatopsis umgeniensis TaxID=336628 RepID=A0A841AU90_9PSEU|nr:anti-sigma factor [Amycolatopsis umgeniensis]MBB5851466.1 anti-sigma-K factor RskA [Amycolatopsis umgeniensis]